jgi:hypothetical protein
MSYIGSQNLILQDSDDVTFEPYGLIKLQRQYICRSNLADSAGRRLVIGSIESKDGISFSIFNIQKKESSGLTFFTVTAYSYKPDVIHYTTTFQERSWSYAVPAVVANASSSLSGKTIPGFNVTIQYLAPTVTMKFCQKRNANSLINPPALPKTATVTYTVAGLSLTPGGTLDVQPVLISRDVENFGAVDVVTAVWSGLK